MRVAAFQRRAVFDDPQTVIASVAADLERADAEGVDLAVFPECYLQGHSYDAAIARRRALALDDAVVKRLCGIGSRTVAVVGLFELRGERVFNSAVVFGGGRLLGVYAKAYPVEDGCSAGTDFPVWTKAGRTFGVNICADINHPRAATALTRQGASLICSPINMMLRPHKAALWRELSVANVRGCAVQSGAGVVSSDVVGENADGWTSHGCTMIVSPGGEIVARAAEGEDGVAVHDLPDGM